MAQSYWVLGFLLCARATRAILNHALIGGIQEVVPSSEQSYMPLQSQYGRDLSSQSE